MAWNFTSTTYEWHDEDLQYAEGSWGQESTATIVRRVRRKDQAIISPLTEYADMVAEGAVKGNLSTLTGMSPGSPTRRLQDTMRLVSTSYQPDAQLRSVRVTMRYATAWYISDTAGATGLMLPSSMSWQTVTRMAKVYRQTWSVNPPATSNTSAEIGGVAIQGAGATATEQVAQMRLRFNFTRDASNTGQAMDTVANNLALALETRNSIAFNVFPAETLICEGYSITQTRMPFYDVTVDMLWDAWSHHEQVAETGADGRPNLTAGNLAAVYWKRAAKGTYDYNLLFGSPVDTAFRTRTFKGFLV